MMTMHDFEPGVTRRTFIGAAAAAAAPLVAPHAFAAPRRRGADVLNVGVIGCGGRGTGAARDALEVSEGARVVALADVFPDRLESCRASLASLGERGRVEERRCFGGFDGYRALLAEDVDVVILAAPPHFRPAHFAAAVAAGKHVFMEKPVAVDPVGARRVMEAASAAQGAGLSVVAGTQRRHEASYRAGMAMLRQGVIGEVVAARCYWNMGGLWMNERRPEWSDMEWQLRNWLYFTWLSGDHIVEQHVHNIDVVSWAMGGPPRRALAVGGRQARTDPRYGHVFDHFAVEYEYDGGRFCLSMCRQQDGCPGRVEEIIHGTEGRLGLSPGRAVIEGERPWRFDGANPNPYVEEHRALQDAIRAGKPVNEGQTVAESTLAAIMGRMAAYTGQEVTWDFAMKSTLDLTPPAYELGSLPVPAVAVPGQTKLT